MMKAGYAKSYRELIVYQRSRKLAQEIFELSRSFPREEMYSLTDQMRRSSRSIGAQIAEAWGKRNYEKHFISKLSDADSETQETRHWIEVSQDCGYVSTSKASGLLLTCDEIGRMLGSMIQKAALFCPKDLGISESLAEYLIPTHNQDSEY